MKLFTTALLSLSLTFFSNAEEIKPVDGFKIKKCSSGVNYPTKGDEYLDVSHNGLTFHAKVLHPSFVDGRHISSPFFWVSEGHGNGVKNLVTAKNHIGGLSWLSINNGFFFSQEKGTKAGFFFEDGFDNWDNGSSGLIYLYDGKDANLYRWEYTRDPAKEKGTYEISSVDDSSKKMEKEVLKVIAPILKLAENEANYWPGP